MDLLQVRLRPFAEPDLEVFDRFAVDPALSEPFEWVGFTPPGGYRKRWEQDGLLGSAPYCLAVVTIDDNAIAGWVDWRETARPGSGAWEIGVLIVPEMRGRGVGAAAQRLLVEYLFSTTTAFRIWAATMASARRGRRVSRLLTAMAPASSGVSQRANDGNIISPRRRRQSWPPP